MSKSVFARVCVGAVIFATVVSAQLTAALTHEAHKMTCDETAMNAMNADIQALPDGDRGSDMTAAEEFWVIKHGIKATGMPAWGVTHSDDMLWDVVAFLRELPDLSPEEYHALSEKAPSHDEVMQEKDADDDHAGDAH